jgi:hypothetical protein
MEAWEGWWNMAQGSLAAALLLYYGMTPPHDREAWSHEATPDLIRRLSGTIISEDARKDIKLRLEACYELRIVADYVGQADVGEPKLKLALKNAAFIINLANDVFP